MKAFIAAWAVLLTSAYANATSVCLNQHQTATMVDQGPRKFRIKSLNDGLLRIEGADQSQSFWVYQATNQTLSAESLRAQCRNRFSEFQQIQLSAVIESLRQSNPLALIFFLSLISSGQAENACRGLEQARLYRLIATGKDPYNFGEVVYLSEAGADWVLMDAQRGLVFKSCSK